MAKITRVGRVMVPVHDQDEAITFYTRVLGFTLTADASFGEGERWVEVTGKGVDTDAELMGGAGGVPAMFFFRDHDKNHLMVVEEG
jgi:lactoylglutathione lyase